MRHLRQIAIQVVSTAVVLTAATPAQAIPVFARKYGTSCLTCHTVYPKLTPFGEAFRRNGYLFPGVDSDFVKQETVALGQEANKKTWPNTVWPSTIPNSVPISVGFNGQVMFYPDKGATYPRANNDSQVVLDTTMEEFHIWAAGAFTDTITAWGEVTIAIDGSVSIEHAQLLFNDLFAPKHAFNLVVGYGFPTIGSFGAHSSYLADQLIPNSPVTGIYGLSTDPFVLVDNYPGLELRGTIAGRIDYAVGWNAGKNSWSSVFNSTNWYAQAGFKVGGMRLDGEGSTGAEDPMRPWAETSLTVDGFVYHSDEHLPNPTTTPPGSSPYTDVSFTGGVGVRGMLGSAELDLGFYSQTHNHGWVTGTGALGQVSTDVTYGELSYIVFPWFVPSLRIENITLRPSGGSTVNDLHIVPGIAFLILANIKVLVVGSIEFSSGFPADGSGAPLSWAGPYPPAGTAPTGSAGWAPMIIGPGTSSTTSSKSQEFESIAIMLAFAM
jgi:hypothetical protein